jgi:hypothetical protein
VAPGARKWPAGVVPAARRRLGLLPGESGAEVMGVSGAAVRWWWWCGGPRSAGGWGAVG